jgi:FlaA1/EpsC-like NDP-sugar epimerase
LVVLDQAETPLHNLTLKFELEQDGLKFTPIVCDIRNKQKLEYLFKTYRPDIIYHCAAYKHVPMMEKNPSEAVAVNIEGTKILADLAVKYEIERFIMISTDKAVNPSSVMGATKRVTEIYLQSLNNEHCNKKDTKFITTRFGNVSGSNGSVIPLFKNQIEQGGPLTITHPDVTRYFITISEACQLVMEASFMASGGEIFIFDMGKPIKIIDIAIKMIQLAGLVPEKDIKIETIGLRPGEKLHEQLIHVESIKLSTNHKRILRIKEIENQYNYIEKEVNKIIRVAKQHDPTEIIKSIKKLIPEYKSSNPTFKKLG